MALRLPTAEDLKSLARANHFELSEGELEGFQSLLPGLFSNYEQLDRMPEPREPLKYPNQDAGYRPSKEEDPSHRPPLRCLGATVEGCAPRLSLKHKRSGSWRIIGLLLLT